MNITFPQTKKIKFNNHSVLKVQDSDGKVLWKRITELTSIKGANLAQARNNLSGASNDNYALFIGGTNWTSSTQGTSSYYTDAYNSTFTHSLPQTARTGDGTATSMNNYILVSVNKGIVSYDLQLTKRSHAVGQASLRSSDMLASSSNSNYALFTDGNTIDTYDKNLTYSTPVSITDTYHYPTGTTLKNYILLGGGVYSKGMNCYDAQLTHTMLTSLRNGGAQMQSTTITDYALFAGGKNSAVVDVYNTSLTRQTAPDLSVIRSGFASASINNVALFYGGHASSRVVDQYDSSLTRSSSFQLENVKFNLAACSLNNFALFAGGTGQNRLPNYDTVEILHFE